MSIDQVVPTEARPSLLQRVPVWVLFCSVASFWGMNTVAMRVAGRAVPPLTVATARALIGSVVLLTVARRKRADWPRTFEEWKGVVAIGLVMTGLSTACLFLAAKNIPAGMLSILTNTMPIWVALLAPVMLGERATTRSIVGLAVGLCGTVIVAWRAIEGNVRPIGIVYGLGAAAATALGSLLYKRYPLARLDRTMVVSMQLFASTVLLGLLSIPNDLSNVHFPWTSTVAFVYLSLMGLALSFVFFSELMRRGTGLQASAVSYLATVLGVGFGAIFLHERLSWLTLLGGAIAIGGVVIVQSPSFGARRRPTS